MSQVATNKFEFKRGDRKSPYLFVLATEGLRIHKKEHKQSQYADDTTLFLKYNEQNIRNCMRTLKEFEQISGLKVNTEKTKVIKIGGGGQGTTG